MQCLRISWGGHFTVQGRGPCENTLKCKNTFKLKILVFTLLLSSQNGGSGGEGVGLTGAFNLKPL